MISTITTENRSIRNLLNFAAVVYLLSLLFNGLDAYTLFGIPITWYGSTLPFLALVVIGSQRNIEVVPATPLFWALVLWLVVITLVNTIFGDYFLQMPSTATTRYSVYIMLRFYNLLAFLSVLYLVYFLCRNGGYRPVVHGTVYVGVFLAGYAIYVYSATVFGWPEILRNRLGTGPTGEQAVKVFTYAFHRALGSFREPSLLAQWLTVPFLLSFIHSSRCKYIYTLIIGTALLLSGSLTGILSIFLGITIASLMFLPYRSNLLKHLYKFVLVLIASCAIFGLFVVGYEGGDYYKETSLVLLTTLIDRITPIVQGGMSMSNRSYVYEYIFNQVPPVFGYGLGHANLLFSGTSEQMVSFLNFYFNMMYSGGLIGLSILILFLLYPLYGFFSSACDKGAATFFILSSYLAWFFIFFASAEEMTMLFGVIYGLLIFHVRELNMPPMRPFEIRAGAAFGGTNISRA